MTIVERNILFNLIKVIIICITVLISIKFLSDKTERLFVISNGGATYTNETIVTHVYITNNEPMSNWPYK